MPIEYQIDHDRRRVMAKARGLLTDEEVFGYQREVWARPDVAGYDELIDMSAVESIFPSSPDRIKHLATVSAAMDVKYRASRLAIVASDDLAFGLGRMYEAYRSLNAMSTKKVEVLRSMESALKWLDSERPELR